MDGELNICMIIGKSSEIMASENNGWSLLNVKYIFNRSFAIRLRIKRALGSEHCGSNSVLFYDRFITGDQLAIGKEAVRPLCVGTIMYPSSSSIVVFPGDQLEIENDSGHLLGMRTNMYLSDESIAALPVLELIEKANGFVGVFPESKYNIVKHLQGLKHKYEMTGHGNKVSFALKMTDIVADDAVRSVSDIVLTEPGLCVIISGRANFQRMNDNVLEFMLHVLKWKFHMPPLTHLIMVVPNDGVVLGAYRAMTLILVARSRNLFFVECQGLLLVGVFLTAGIEVLEGRQESPGGSQWDFSVLKPPFDLPKHVIVEAISRALNMSACVRMNTVIGIGVAGATNITRSASDFWLMKKPGVISSLLSSRAIFQRLLVNTLVYATSFTIWIVVDIMMLALIWKFDYPLMVLIIATSWTIMTPLLDSSKDIHNI